MSIILRVAAPDGVRFEDGDLDPMIGKEWPLQTRVGWLTEQAILRSAEILPDGDAMIVVDMIPKLL